MGGGEGGGRRDGGELGEIGLLLEGKGRFRLSLSLMGEARGVGTKWKREEEEEGGWRVVVEGRRSKCRELKGRSKGRAHFSFFHRLRIELVQEDLHDSRVDPLAHLILLRETLPRRKGHPNKQRPRRWFHEGIYLASSGPQLPRNPSLIFSLLILTPSLPSSSSLARSRLLNLL